MRHSRKHWESHGDWAELNGCKNSVSNEHGYKGTPVTREPLGLSVCQSVRLSILLSVCLSLSLCLSFPLTVFCHTQRYVTATIVRWKELSVWQVLAVRGRLFHGKAHKRLFSVTYWFAYSMDKSFLFKYTYLDTITIHNTYTNKI